MEGLNFLRLKSRSAVSEGPSPLLNSFSKEFRRIHESDGLDFVPACRRQQSERAMDTAREKERARVGGFDPTESSESDRELEKLQARVWERVSLLDSARNPAADRGSARSDCFAAVGTPEKCCVLQALPGGPAFFKRSFFFGGQIVPIHLPCETGMWKPRSGASDQSVTGSFSAQPTPRSRGCLSKTAALCREGDLVVVAVAESPV